MQGKTRGVFEDIFVLLVIVAVGWGGYTFFFTEDETLSSNTTIVQSQSTKHLQEQTKSPTNQLSIEKIQTETTNVIVNKTNDTESKNSVEKKVEIVTNSIQENKKENYENVTKDEIIEKIIKNDIKVTTTDVDLEMLQKFLIETKKKIKNSILISSENNNKKQKLSIRLTVLKNGTFEQLIYTGGDRNIFENNYNNIAKNFPVKIDENIAGDFPRYLRYSFEFSVKEE